MSAKPIGGDWVAAYLDWTQWDAAGERAILPSLSASDGIRETLACSCEETVSAYLEWMAAVPVAGAETFARGTDSAFRALPIEDTTTLDAFRESMLLTALRTEADYLHILRRVMDAGDAAFPARKLVVNALTQAEKLLDDEQRAWCALIGLRSGNLPEPRAERERDFPGDWPRALKGVAADVHALAGKILELQVH